MQPRRLLAAGRLRRSRTPPRSMNDNVRCVPHRANRYRVMSNEYSRTSDPDQPMVYQIRVKGHLSDQWSDWFDGLAVTSEDNGDTLLIGPLVDQAALYGLLKKVRDVGIVLLSVNRVWPGQADVPNVRA